MSVHRPFKSQGSLSASTIPECALHLAPHGLLDVIEVDLDCLPALLCWTSRSLDHRDLLGRRRVDGNTRLLRKAVLQSVEEAVEGSIRQRNIQSLIEAPQGECLGGEAGVPRDLRTEPRQRTEGVVTLTRT
jgi:hypothetical protein